MSDWAVCLGSALAGAAFAAKCDEYRHEARRCRRMSRAVLEASGDNGAVIDFYVDKRINRHSDPGFGLVICAPGLDETNLGAAAVEVLHEYLAAMGLPRNSVTIDPDKTKILGTEGDE